MTIRTLSSSSVAAACLRATAIIGCAVLTISCGAGDAPTNRTPAGLVVFTSPGFAASGQLLGADFEVGNSVTVVVERFPSTPAVQQRLAEGGAADMVILTVDGMDELVDGGTVDASTRTRLGSTGVGIAVPAGSPAPDISTLDGLRGALLAARAVAYSAGPSGTHISDVVLARLGIEEEVTAKSVRTSAVPDALMNGEVELGFQQMSELIPIEGIQYVGPLPEEVQNRTPYDAAVVAGSANPELARTLIDFFASPGADPTIQRMGLER